MCTKREIYTVIPQAHDTTFSCKKAVDNEKVTPRVGAE